MRYCIFGGSFDPPHEGHRYLARSARDSLRLDRIFWVPSPDPPHKNRPQAPFRDRLAMVRLAIAGMPGQEASGIEETLPRPSYSIHTIAALKSAHGAGHAWHFLVGADNWDIIRTWHRWEDVLREVTMVVFPRGGRSLDGLPAFAPGSGKEGPGVLRLDLPELGIESRRIREALAATGKADAAGVLPELKEYILAHGLYGTRGRTDGADRGRAAL